MSGVPYLQLMGAAVTSGAQIGQGITANRAAKVNAASLEDQAAATVRSSIQREEIQRANARAQIGEGLAAGGGIEGSTLDVLRQSMFNSEMDALAIRYEGQSKATEMRNEAANARFQGRGARNAGFLTAAGTLMSGAASYLSAGGKLPAFEFGRVRSDGSMMETGRMSQDWLRRSEKRGY